MGSSGQRRQRTRRRKHRSLPKVRGNPGELFRGGWGPWSVGSFEQHVGRVGPKAQERYLRHRPGALLTGRVAAGLLAASALLAFGAIALR
jgi:hypothetical protein